MTRGRTDYPLAETQPDAVKGKRGKSFSTITLDKVLAGDVTMDDLRITPDALGAQAEISRDAGRASLARNFERAAELVDVPQDLIMEIYELLRPGRAKSKQQLLDAAHRLRTVHGCAQTAAFIEEAAHIYEQRGLFARRF